jgi:hypothetical protein
MCELGATWADSKNFFPILVPPIGYDNLKAVLVGVHTGAIDSKDILSNLRDRLIEAGSGAGATSKWESKRDAFLRQCPKMLKNLKGASNIPVAQHEQLQRTYAAAQETISELSDTIASMCRKIADLENCKDREEVKRVRSEHSTEDEEFVDLTRAAKSAIAGLPQIVIEALYQFELNGRWTVDTGFGTDDLWRSIESGREKQMLTVNSATVLPNTEHPKVQRAVEAVQDLAAFVEGSSDDFRAAFKHHHDYPLSTQNKDFWKAFLR